MLKGYTDSRLRLWRNHSLLTIIFAIGGCSTATTYNLAYVPNELGQMKESVRGKGLIYTEKAGDLYVYTGKPTSFTGNANTLTIPLGAITTGIAGTVFGRMFTDGFESSNSLTNLSQYRVVIKPKATKFTYEYNQLKNAGFAVTPTAQISLEVKLLDNNGKPYWEKSYDSGIQEGPAYLISGSPGEEISKVAHKTVYTLMTQAATDVRSLITSQNENNK